MENLTVQQPNAAQRRRLMRSLNSSQAVGEAKQLLRPMARNSETAVSLGARVRVLLSLYWQPSDDERVRKAALAAWIDTLCEFPMWAVDEAMADWRNNQTNRPTPAHIRQRCIQLTGEVHAAIARASAEPEPNLRYPTDDEKARVDGVVKEFLKHRRFGAKKPQTHEAEHG